MLTVTLPALFTLIFGLVFCFAGYRLFMIMLPVVGFLGGFWLGAEMVSLFTGRGFLDSTAGWAGALFGGLLLALLSYNFYRLGIAILAAVFGFNLGTALMHALGFRAITVVLPVAIIAAVLVMVLAQALNVQKYVIIVITAAGGANALVLGTLMLSGRANVAALRTPSDIQPLLQGPWLWAWLIVAALGFIVQATANRAYKHKRKERRQEKDQN